MHNEKLIGTSTSLASVDRDHAHQLVALLTNRNATYQYYHNLVSSPYFVTTNYKHGNEELIWIETSAKLIGRVST